MRNAGLEETQAGIKIAERNINNLRYAVAAAAAKSLQSCPTLCNPMDCSLPGFSVHGILQARTLEWVAISFSSIKGACAWIGASLWLVCIHCAPRVHAPELGKSLWLFVAYLWAHLGHTRGLFRDQFSSVQFSHSVVSDSLRPHELQHARPPCPSPTPGVHSHSRRVSDAIQPSHSLSSPSPPAPNPSQHQGLFKWVSSSHQVAKSHVIYILNIRKVEMQGEW